MNKKEKKIYNEEVERIKGYLRKDYPDLRKMPKDVKMRFKILKNYYKDVVKIRVLNGALPIDYE